MSVILTKHSVGRIPRWDFARDFFEMLHYVQHDTIAVKKPIWVDIYIIT